MAALDGLGILVTRPERQASALCRLLSAAGGTPVRFPVMEIRARADRAAVRAAVGPVDRYGLIVFVSANAVRFGTALLEQRRELRLVAVGGATAQALNAAGYRVALRPDDGADSDALLRLPELQHLSGQRVLIVRGTGGREHLANQLVARGAEVVYAEVYERHPASPSPDQLAHLEKLWTQGAIHVYTVTSVDLLDMLLPLLPVACRDKLPVTTALVGSERIAARLRGLDLGSPVVVADSSEDTSLVDALSRWRARRRT
jgi:uroporphyrinogen-III synthase